MKRNSAPIVVKQKLRRSVAASIAASKKGWRTRRRMKAAAEARA